MTEGTLGNADEWGADVGSVWFVIHPGNDTHEQALGFDPSVGFHRYGFLWTPEEITWAVDGESVFTNAELPEALSAPDDGRDLGTIMMNAWIGNEHWGGDEPPAEDQTAAYDYVWYLPEATSVPEEGPR